MDIHPSAHPPHEALVIKEFSIKPSQAVKVELGTFRQEGRQPEFTVHVHDQARLESPGALVYSDISLSSDDGTYRLVRNFQSYSQRTHVVTVGFAAVGDVGLGVE